jgi:hypothetical protein
MVWTSSAFLNSHIFAARGGRMIASGADGACRFFGVLNVRPLIVLQSLKGVNTHFVLPRQEQSQSWL